MIRKSTIFFILFLVISAGNLSGASIVETHGAMKVSGTKIIGTKSNQVVQAAGMCLFWSTWGGQKFYNKQAVDWLVKDWNVTLTRTSMGIEPRDTFVVSHNGYIYNKDNQKAYVKAAVDAAIANGIYIIIDWHDHNATRNVSEAVKFFEEMAKQYKNTPNIIWELWNEPDNKFGSRKDTTDTTKYWDTWDDIKKYSNQVIPAIRKYSSNLIVVGTPTWSQDVDSAALSPLPYKNIAYALHFYAGTHNTALRKKADFAISKGIALFITEFGLSIADGGNSDKTVYTDSTKVWLDWADSNNLSWCNWSIVDKNESSAALLPGASPTGRWKMSDISVSGTWIRNRLLSRTVYKNTSVRKAVNVDTLILSGRIEAERFTTKSAELTIDSSTHEPGTKYLGSATNGSWAEYIVNVAEAGKYVALASVATEMNGSIIFIANDSVRTQWSIANTGGAQLWQSTDISPAFDLSAGTNTIRIEWNWPGYINLNSIDILPINVATEIKSNSSVIKSLKIAQSVLTADVINVKTVSLISPTGKELAAVNAPTGTLKLPLGKGLHLLKAEKTGGGIDSVFVNGN